MGCCILGALIIGRWIYAYRRTRDFFQRIGPGVATLVAAEAVVLVALALYETPVAHRDHLLSLMPGTAIAGQAEPSTAVCSRDAEPTP